MDTENRKPFTYPATIHAVGEFGSWLGRWSLTADGNLIHTDSSDLLPVRRSGAPAMLKIARTEEERRGASVLRWYGGNGAVRVLEIDGQAVLLERMDCSRSLVAMSKAGEDGSATKLLCSVARRLHEQREEVPPDVVSHERWLRSLLGSRDPLLARAQSFARELLADPRDVGVLHGDIHHGNVLYDARCGWLAIDPKGVLGERAFDYTNIFCNPDRATATAPGRLARHVEIISEEAAIDPKRLLKWAVAYAGLSAAWSVEDGSDPSTAFAVVQIASALIA